MLGSYSSAANDNATTPGFYRCVCERWTNVRELFYGFKVTWVSVASVLLGTILFGKAPQVQDLFLEVTGDNAKNARFWIWFYVWVVVAWAVPVYISSRWILSRFEEKPFGQTFQDVRPVRTWVRRVVPSLLVVGCYTAILIGQLTALANAPSISDAASSWGLGDDFLSVVGVFGLALLWLYLRPWLYTESLQHISGKALWWIVFVGLAAAVIYILYQAWLFTREQWSIQFGLGHLAVLPLLTLIAAYFALWGLSLDRKGKVTPFARLLLSLSGVSGTSDEGVVAKRLVNPLYVAILLASIALIAIAFLYHPTQITKYAYRAALLPFLLGVLVAPFTGISYWSIRSRVPLILILVLATASMPLFFGDTNDVRTLKLTAFDERMPIEVAVDRWAKVNGCDVTKAENAAACPSPFVISVAGGASRSAFHLAGLIGKLMDENPRNRRGSDAVPNLRPFEKQLFAISAVSGGSVGAVLAYAALADSQTAKVDKNDVVKPPCKEGVPDNDWFGSPVSKDRTDSNGPQPHESWRACLQLLAAGDFLSPVMVRLFSADPIHYRGRWGDRAAVLEEAWEIRYERLTGQEEDKAPNAQPSAQNDKDSKSKRSCKGNKVSTLRRCLSRLRRDVLQEDENWLPILLLNGTSVATGRRIVTSDVDMRVIQGVFVTERLFRDTYDLHELLMQKNSEDQPYLTDQYRSPKHDIRLSTAGTMSARFPVISPHGNIRGLDDKIIDRVVDGGYFENFGAITALELARWLQDKYKLKPVIVFVNNEPSISRIECVLQEPLFARPEAPQLSWFASLGSPLKALFATREARGTLAAAELCSYITDEEAHTNRFAFIPVSPDEYNPNMALSMSWWLSKRVQKYLDQQLAPDLESENLSDEAKRLDEAFGKIRDVRMVLQN